MPGTPLTLANADHVVAAIPYLLGFPPQDSVVLQFLDDNRLMLTSRSDLTDPYAPEVLADMIRAGLQSGATSVGVAVYSPELYPADRLLADIAADLPVRFAINVVHDAWTCYLTGNGSFTPVDQAEVTRVAAEFVAAGATITSSRDLILAEVTPGSAFDQDRTHVHVAEQMQAAEDHELPRWRTQVIWQATQHLIGVPGLDRAQIAVGVRDIHVRDMVLVNLAHAVQDGAEPAAMRQAANEIVRACEPGYAANALTMSAVVNYLAGDGVRVAAALAAAEQDAPGHSFTTLLSQVLARGIPPTVVLDMLLQVEDEVIARVGPLSAGVNDEAVAAQ